MAQSHTLLVGSLLITTAMAAACAGEIVNDPRRSDAVPSAGGTFTYISEQALVYREEAAELRAAALYYEGEARRSTQETGRDLDRARRYHEFADLASEQAKEADRYAAFYQRQLL